MHSIAVITVVLAGIASFIYSCMLTMLMSRYNAKWPITLLYVPQLLITVITAISINVFIPSTAFKGECLTGINILRLGVTIIIIYNFLSFALIKSYLILKFRLEPPSCHLVISLGKLLSSMSSLSLQVYQWVPVTYHWGNHGVD